MRYGSVCSGIESASVAWHPLGWKAAWLSEIDAFPSAVLKHHYPDVPNLGDMTLIAERIRAGEVEAPDILVGGTPCQGFSVAGLRGGLSDPRGQLTLAFVEIANAIDERRLAERKPPVIIVWENVPGVLSDRSNAFGHFLGALAGEDEPLLPPGKRWSDAGAVLGPCRSIAYRILDAQHFRLAQRRRRVFVIASAGLVSPFDILFEPESVRGHLATSGGTKQVAPPDARRRTASASHWDDFKLPHPTLSQSHNTGGLGGSNQELFSQRGASLVPIAFGGNNTSGPITVATARNACASASGRMDFETETLLVVPETMGVRRITPTEAEKLQGFPPGYTAIPWRKKPADQCPDGPRQKALGNSMAVPCMSFLAKRIQQHIGG